MQSKDDIGDEDEMLNTKLPTAPKLEKKIPRHTPGVLRTKNGRLIKAEEWLQAEKRLLQRPVHPSVDSFLHFKQVPVARFQGKDDLEASIERLSVRQGKGQPEDGQQKPHWIKQELQNGRWHDVTVPWRRIGTAERRTKCVEMHDRAQADQQGKLNRLLDKYCKPLRNSESITSQKYTEKLVKQFCGRPHLLSQSPYRTAK